MASPADLTVPVLMDSAKRFDNNIFLRSTFFWIEIDEAIPVNIQSREPLVDGAFLLGGRALVSGPGEGESLFESSQTIDRLFDDVEQDEGYRICTGTAWVPDSGAMDGKTAWERGSVLRVPLDLFLASHAFGEAELDSGHLVEKWRGTDLKALHSDVETKAFQGWMKARIEDSRTRHHDPARVDFMLPRKQPLNKV